MVRDADDAGLWQQGLRQQIFLGDEAFVTRSLQALAPPPERRRNVPRAQLRQPASLPALLATSLDRGQAMRAAYTRGGFTMSQIAAHVGLSISRVSRLISAAEAQAEASPAAALHTS